MQGERESCRETGRQQGREAGRQAGRQAGLLGLHVAKFWGIDDLDLCQRNAPLSTLSVVSPRGRL